MHNYTSEVKAALKCRIKRDNDSAIHGGSFRNINSWNAEDELLRDGVSISKNDNDWIIYRHNPRNWREKTEVARFPRKLSQRKTCLAYTDVMPSVPKIEF